MGCREDARSSLICETDTTNRFLASSWFRQVQFPSSYACINPCFTAGKISGVGNCHAAWRQQKTTVCTSIVYVYAEHEATPRMERPACSFNTEISSTGVTGIVRPIWSRLRCSTSSEFNMMRIHGPRWVDARRAIL
jgi:hypothetical protein